MKKRMNIKTGSIASAILLVIILLFWLVPIVKKNMVLNGINKQISVLTKANANLSGQIDQLWMDWRKCEDLQITTATQAQGKRDEMTKNDDQINKLETQYNQIAGFTSGL